MWESNGSQVRSPSKNTNPSERTPRACLFLSNLHEVFFEKDSCSWKGIWPANRSFPTFCRGSMPWAKAVRFLEDKHWLEWGVYHSPTAFELCFNKNPTLGLNHIIFDLYFPDTTLVRAASNWSMLALAAGRGQPLLSLFSPIFSRGFSKASSCFNSNCFLYHQTKSSFKILG